MLCSLRNQFISSTCKSRVSILITKLAYYHIWLIFKVVIGIDGLGSRVFTSFNHKTT